MKNDPPLYNSRIARNYLDYLSRHHPGCDIEGILKYAGFSRLEVDDPSRWFTQGQMDRFHEAIVRETGNEDISRSAGRYSAWSESMGVARQYLLGMITPSSAYMLFGRLSSLFTRAARVETRKAGPRMVEIVCVPEPGVEEKPFQCRNRLGKIEALTVPFTGRLAEVEHTECIHEGGEACRYLAQVPKVEHMVWRRARNITGTAGLPALLIMALAASADVWVPAALSVALLFTVLAWNADRLEKKTLAQTLRTQGEAAKGRIDEMKIREKNALLVQEIGSAASSIRDEEGMIHSILNAMEKRLNFERGMILLAPEGGSFLTYAGGYGYRLEEEAVFKDLRIPCVDIPSAAPRHTGMGSSSPILLETPGTMEENLPAELAGMLVGLGVRDCVAAPLVYERRIMGMLVFHHAFPAWPINRSDLLLIEGVAYHTAVSIAGTRSYRRVEVNERNYRELVQGANSVILRCDPGGLVLFINRFASELFGFSEEEMKGRSVIGTILPDEERVRVALNRLVSHLEQDPKTGLVTENRNLHRSGKEIWIAWTYRPLFEEDGTLREILAIGNDITELRTERKEKAALASRLERAGRMEAAGALAGGVAHELNNILSGIVSYPELLLMDLPQDSPLRRPIGLIQRSGERAAEIVQDMLLLSRRGVSATLPISMDRIISMYLDGGAHRELAAGNPGVLVEFAPGVKLPPVPGSEEHLTRALEGLVHYGFQAMPSGGVLRIETEPVTLSDEYVGYEPVKPGEYVILRVSHGGPAPAREHLERIFEPFYAKKVLNRPGTGLGLPVVWGIVKGHGGFVDVRAGEESGTTFSLFFPVAGEGGQQASADKAAESSIMGRGETVLVVDDIDEQRVLAESILKRLNYLPVTLESGEAAVGYLKEQSADLVILDMVMEPGMDGLDTYREILSVRPGQKAIIASGYSESQRVREAERLGVGAYLKKPYSVEMLGRAIRMELDRETG